MNVVILATYDKIFTTDLYCRENEAIQTSSLEHYRVITLPDSTIFRI